YIFFKSSNIKNLQEILLNKHNIFIRSCNNYYGLNDFYYRIGISTSENNQKLIKALQDINNCGG
ncbi:MAG: threonine-phosphate decarboxylase, partial [Oscillospiraceae bacterium]